MTFSPGFPGRLEAVGLKPGRNLIASEAVSILQVNDLLLQRATFASVGAGALGARRAAGSQVFAENRVCLRQIV